MCKDFEFKVGMGFSILTQFKEAIMENTVLNAKEVTFIKNDKKKVRVVCSQNCGFLCLCSKYGRDETYRIKTLF